MSSLHSDKGDIGDPKGNTSRRVFLSQLGAAGIGMVGVTRTSEYNGNPERSGPALENEALRLSFNGESGLLTAIENKLTKEAMKVEGDDFTVAADEFTLTPHDSHLESLQKETEELVQATFRMNGRTVVASYTLGTNNHFFEKHLVIRSPTPYRLKSLVVSKLRSHGAALKFLKYPYQKNVAYFGRTPGGGIFLGMELPFDSSSLDPHGGITLAYQPSLKVKANEPVESEPMFFGVYKRSPADANESDQPMRSESEAMVRMASAIVGPPRHDFVPMACGWWCEMEHHTYLTEAQVEGEIRSLDFLAECGVDWVSDSHPWGGEIDKINRLRQGDHYEPGPLVKKFLSYANEKKVKVVFWPTMNNTDPWWEGKGEPFRPDRRDWLMSPEGQDLSYTLPTGRTFKASVKGNCIANESFFNWLMGIHLDGMRTGYFAAWGMDGDLFGGGGLVLPVNCPSDQHDHLPGDSNYASERALNRMMAKILREYPETYMSVARPPMDLGIWSNRFADTVFTIDEFGSVEPLPGLSGQPLNVIMGDKIRTWSRIRVQRHFFPHYLDWPLVFAPPRSMGGPEWASDKIDYVMLSALSCSPKQLYYLPTKAGIPARDKAEILKWLDWGRENSRYLQVRKDLAEWPGVEKVDGSAHIIGDRGLIFLFNPNATALVGRFRLDTDTLGLSAGTRFEIGQSYPVADAKQQRNFGEESVWQVPNQGVTVLSVRPLG
jgi:hypothetical protein